MLNAEINLRNDAAARVEWGCPHFAGMFALGASVEMMLEVGMQNIQQRVLTLNRYLTDRLNESGCRVLSPLSTDEDRSAETLVSMENPGDVVARLAREGVVVTEKPQGIRVATDFFNDESDIDRLIEGLANLKKV